MKVKSNPPITLLSIVFGLLVINLLIKNNVILFGAITISGIGIFSVKISKLIEKFWYKLSYILSQIIPNILLSLIYYVFLTPLSLLMKLFKGKSEYTLFNKKASIFIEKNKSFTKESFKRAW